MASINFVVLTVSDSCFAKTAVDKSGPKLVECIKGSFPDSHVLHTEILPDELSLIKESLCIWSSKNCDVIFTTGGTGFSSRDVTPEATKSVIDREAPGLSFAMLSKSLAITDLAMLSRSVCGIKRKTLIVNLPGSVKAVSECFDIIKNAIPHAVSLLKDNLAAIKQVHSKHTALHCEPSKVKMNQVAFRSRTSPYAMLEVEDAKNLIIQCCLTSKLSEVIDVSKSKGRVLYEDVRSQESVPPFDASIKDGYAVIAEDGTGIRRVRDVVAAGDAPFNKPMVSGEIVRISTGACVPCGANAVVQVEDTELIEATPDGSKEIRVKINCVPKAGQDIRRCGSDILSGAQIMSAGDFLTAAHVGVLASVGVTKLTVFKRPSVGVLSTGNELQELHEILKPGHIRDSNKLTLMSLLTSYGYEPRDCVIAKDNPDSVKQALVNALSNNDVVITTGGVSMGEFDVMKRVLEDDFQAKIHFGRVNMKPGKPTTFATCDFENKPKIIFSLPGNPVSAMVTCIIFAIPGLRKMENNSQDLYSRIMVPLGIDTTLDFRPEYARVALKSVPGESTLQALPVGNQISSKLNSFVGANALLYLPAKTDEKSVCRKGELLEAILLPQ